MNPFRSLARLVALVLVCALSAREASAQAIPVAVKTSEKLEAILILNALGGTDNPRFGEFPKLKEFLQPMIDADPAAKDGFAAWKGEGIALCYLLCDVGGDTLAGLLAVLAKPEEACAAAEKGLDEPIYRPALERLKKDSAKLTAFLQFLNRGIGDSPNWSDFYQRSVAPVFLTVLPQATEAMQKLDDAKVRAAVTPYAGALDPAPIELWITNFSGNMAFKLKGNREAISVPMAASAPFLLCHELCRRYVPTEATLAQLKTLAEKDPFYGSAVRRIHVDLKEPAEEEFHEAAWLAASVNLGLQTHRGALRSIKFSHAVGTGLPPDSAGSPVVGIIFAELSAAPPGAGLAYDAFLQKLFADGKIAAGTVQAKYEEAIAEVLGIAGLSTEVKEGRLMIAKVIPGLPAEAGGLMVGDELIKVDDFAILPPIDLNVIMDHLAGRRGDERVLGVRRLDKTVDVKFKLK